MLVSIILAAAIGSPVFAQEAQVRVEPRPERQEVVYRIAEGKCDIQWTVYQSEINRGVIQHRGTCELPMREQSPLIRKLLESTMKDPETAKSFHTLSVGLVNAFPGLSARLATLGRESSGWDLRAGRPKSGTINGFVRDLARQGRFFAEWQDAFKVFQRQIEVAHVEEVAVAPAGELPFFGQLKGQGIRHRDRVPYNCDVWLKVNAGGK